MIGFIRAHIVACLSGISLKFYGSVLESQALPACLAVIEVYFAR